MNAMSEADIRRESRLEGRREMRRRIADQMDAEAKRWHDSAVETPNGDVARAALHTSAAFRLFARKIRETDT